MGNEDVELITATNTQERRSLREKWEIPLENLSFEYITDCRNVKEVERMVLILRSGEEGHFPELTAHAEKRLSELQPDSRILRVAQPILTPSMLDKREREQLDNDMSEWLKQMHLRDKDLEDGRSLELNDSLPRPDVRKISQSKASTSKSAEKPQRIKSCDYASWDKYDVDTELNRIDLRAEREQAEARKFQKKMKEKKLLEEAAINKLTLTGTEISVLAEKEREKGNEAFRAGDYSEALHHYGLSLAIDSTINGYNNRAITYIKLNKFDEAIKDCDRVLSMDYTNVKAMLRRALALENLRRNAEALAEYTAVLKIEPNNKVAISGVRKLSVYSESKKVRMKIEELANDKMREKSLIQELKPSRAKIEEFRADEEVVELKPVKRQMKEVKFTRDERIERRGNEICFCDRAPSSSQYSQPLPHRKGEYCLGNDRNPSKKSQSIFTCSNSSSSYSKPPGVVIEEILSEPCNKITKEGKKREPVEKIEKSRRHSSDGKRAAEFTKSIESPYEFLCAWQTLRDDPDLKLHAQLLRTLGPRNLEPIIGSKLDGEMLSIILRCLEKHFCNEEDKDFVCDFLKSLSELTRFSIVRLFMDSGDKKAANQIIYFLEKHEIPEAKNFRDSYSVP